MHSDTELHLLNGCYRDYQFEPNTICIDLNQVYDYCWCGVRAVLQQCIEEGTNIKAWMTIAVLFHKIDIKTGEVELSDTTFFSTHATPIFVAKDIDNFMSDSSIKLNGKVEEYVNKGSNWIVGSINAVIVKLVKY